MYFVRNDKIKLWYMKKSFGSEIVNYRITHTSVDSLTHMDVIRSQCVTKYEYVEDTRFFRVESGPSKSRDTS